MVEDFRKTPDQELEEAQEKTKPTTTVDTIRNVPKWAWVAFFAGTMFWYYNTYITKTWVNNSYGKGWLLLLGGFLFFIFFMNKEVVKDFISEREAKKIVLEELKWKRDHTDEIPPNADIRVPDECRLPEIEDMEGNKKLGRWLVPYSWQVPDKMPIKRYMELDPRTGKVMGIRRLGSAGFTGDELKSVKVFVPEKTRMQVDWDTGIYDRRARTARRRYR